MLSHRDNSGAAKVIGLFGSKSNYILYSYGASDVQISTTFTSSYKFFFYMSVDYSAGVAYSAMFAYTIGNLLNSIDTVSYSGGFIPACQLFVGGIGTGNYQPYGTITGLKLFNFYSQNWYAHMVQTSIKIEFLIVSTNFLADFINEFRPKRWGYLVL